MLHLGNVAILKVERAKLTLRQRLKAAWPDLSGYAAALRKGVFPLLTPDGLFRMNYLDTIGGYSPLDEHSF